MNKILKKILLTTKDIAITTASESLPGAGIVIGGVTKLFDKEDDNNKQALVDIENGLIEAIRSLDAAKVSDAMLVAAGLKEIQDGFEKVRAGLKH